MDAVEVIYRHTGGVCRLINALCDRCLFSGAQEKVDHIDRTLVMRFADPR